MKIFDAYAKYYDLLYRDKNYKEEAEYIEKFINKFKPGAESILDLGCGTGRHDIILAQKGFAVTGIELSEKMTKLAGENKSGAKGKTEFINGDIRNIRLEKKFDIIISLFHVINYQITNHDLSAAFRTVKEHLKPDGKFIFDFWYGPAVLSDRPLFKVRKMEDDECIIERTTEPVMNVNENYVEVNFKMNIEDLKNRSFQKIEETHRMRYLFLPEINYLLGELNMKIEHKEEWMSGKELSDKSWYGLAVCGNI